MKYVDDGTPMGFEVLQWLQVALRQPSQNAQITCGLLFFLVQNGFPPI